MDGRKNLSEGSLFAVREDIVEMSTISSKVSVGEEPLQVAVKDTGPLKSCMLASEGKESEQEVRESKRAHSSGELESQAKGVKRNLLEAHENGVEIGHCARSATHEKFAEEVEGSGVGPVENIMNGENKEGDGSRSRKRIKLKSSVISRTDHSGSAGRGRGNEWIELSKARNVQTGLKDVKALKSNERKASKSNSLTNENKQKWETHDRWKGKTHVYPCSEFVRSRMEKTERSRRDRDEENRTNGQRSKDCPGGEPSRLVSQRTRLDVHQFTRTVKKGRNSLFIRDGNFRRGNLKWGRGHQSKIMEDSKKKKDMPKRIREDAVRAREHEVKLSARSSKLWVEDHDVIREDQRVPRDRVDRFRAGEVQEILEEGRSEKQSSRQDEREQGNSRGHARQLRHNCNLGHQHRADQYGEDVLTKHWEGDFQFHRLSWNLDRRQAQEGFIKGNVEYRGHLAGRNDGQSSRGATLGSDGDRWRDDQMVQRDEYRPGKRVEIDKNFARNQKRIDKIGRKERFGQKLRGIDEEQDLLRPIPKDQKSGKENVDHTSSKDRGADRPGNMDIKGAGHELGSPISATQGFEGCSNRRCSRKVVNPRQLDEPDVWGSINKYGGKVTKSCKEAAIWVGSQENSGRGYEEQKENTKTLNPFEAGKSILQEGPSGASESARQVVVEIDHGPGASRKDKLHQLRSNSVTRDILKHSNKRRRNLVETPEEIGNLRIEDAHSKEKSMNKGVQEAESSFEKQVKHGFKREEATEQKSLPTERGVQERVEDIAPRRSVEALQLKPVKVMRERKEKSSEFLLRRQAVRIRRNKGDVSSYKHRCQKHRSSSHSVSPNIQKWLLSPKEHGKSTSPHRSEKNWTEWDKFERERNNTLPAFDSRFRRFGGGTSGLGGYSPRRRRSEAAIKTPSPPSRSPERRKPQTWDSIPPGVDTSMIAAISAAHHAAVHHALVTVTTVAPLVPGSMLVSPVVTPTSVSSGVLTAPSMIPSLLPQVNPAVTAVTLTQATRPLRRLYVGNVPATVSDGELLEFMNAAMLSANANHLPGTKPCINCSVNLEKSHAFAEFITPEDATAALAFDGVTLHGTTLKIRRPKDFVLPSTSGIETASAVLDMVSNNVVDSIHKVFVGGIPSSLTADKVKEIVTAFGQLKAYHWEVDYEMQHPRAFAFLEYMDPTATLNACAGLNGMRLGSGFLTVVQATPDADSEMVSSKAPFYGIPEHAKTLLEPPSRVLEIHNLVTAAEVPNLSKEDAEVLIEDVRLECTRFGNVKSTHMVQPWARPELEIENSSLDKIENIAMKIVRGLNLDYGSVPESIQQQVTEEELPNEKTETLNELSTSPSERQSSSSLRANEEQMLATDGEDRLSLDQLSEGNEKYNDRDDSPVNESRLVQVLGNLSKEWQPNMNSGQSETIIPSDEHEIPNAFEVGGNSGLSNGSLTDLHLSSKEWETSHVGKVYVEFSREEAARQAAHALHGRFFAGHKVDVYYFPLQLYQKRFQKGLGPRTLQEKQALALAVQGHLTAHIKD